MSPTSTEIQAPYRDNGPGVLLTIALWGLVAALTAFLAGRVYVFVTSNVLLRGPTGAGFGADFAMFLGAAKVLALGGNPYNPAVLFASEHRMLAAQHLLMTKHVGLVRVGNPPLFFWLLQPLTRLPYQPVALVWILGMWSLAGLGLFAVLRYFGWRRKLLPCLLFLFTPQVLVGVTVGNVAPLVFAAVACSLLLLRRYPVAAGLTLGAVWLKPQIGLPIVGLIILFHSERPRSVVAGFLAGTVALIGLTLATVGPHVLVDWLHALQGYNRDIAHQVWVSSLASIYYTWAPMTLRIALIGLSLGLATVLTLACWWKCGATRPAPWTSVAWLWVVWFLVTPYAHIDDEIVLAIPVVAVLGRDARRLSQAVPAFALFLMLFSAARDLSWILIELALGLAILLLPDRAPERFVPLWWRPILFAILVVSVLPAWASRGVDMESFEILGVALCAFLVAAYGRPMAAGVESLSAERQLAPDELWRAREPETEQSAYIGPRR